MRNTFKVGNLLVPRLGSKLDDNLLILSCIGNSFLNAPWWQIVDTLTGKTYYAAESDLLMSYEIVECSPPANNHKSK